MRDRARWMPARLACLLLWLGPGAAASAAADRVAYEAVFEADWSASTHPTDFPSDPHFSGLVGGTHDASVSFFAPGELASIGIERMAEKGRQAPLIREVEDAIAEGRAGFVISGDAISPSPGVGLARFAISLSHPQVTLVAMIAPSPDWFVGVHGLPLYDDGWLDGVEVDLFAYDAGTDSGTAFTAEDADTQPPEPIAGIAGFPFSGAPALGRFRFERLLACSDGIDNDGDGLIDSDGGGGTPDPGCQGNPERDTERAGAACGLGFEASLASLLALRLRRWARPERGA